MVCGPGCGSCFGVLVFVLWGYIVAGLGWVDADMVYIGFLGFDVAV